MLDGMADFMSCYAKGSHAVRIVHGLAKPKRFGSGVIMIAQFSGNPFNADIVYIVVLSRCYGQCLHR